MSSLNLRAQQTARHASMLRSIGLGARRRRLPRQIWPKSIEAEYAKHMVGMLDAARPALAPLIRELPGLLAGAAADRRIDAGESERARRLIESARQRLEHQMQPHELERIAEMFGKRTQSYQRAQLSRQVRAALGVDVMAGEGRRVRTLLEHFVGENVSLIKSVPAGMLGEIEKLVGRAFTSGTRHEDLAGEIEERFGVAESRARLIARDQVGKLYGQTNAARQQDLGIEAFIWRTAGDERVRDEHAALDGQEFRYDDPPSEGLPGEPIQCRCYAEPVIDLIRAASDGAGDET